jgi:hypothetical protein
MNKFQIIILKSLRKSYQFIFKTEINKKNECIQDADLASQLIYEALTSDKPCMIGRFGSNELLCLVSYLGVKESNKNILSFISGKSQAWWWNKKNLANMHINAGFFPPEIYEFEKFCQLMLRDMQELDVLGSWLVEENIIYDQLKRSKRVDFRLLEPFWSKFPWTHALMDKNVLVIHPFAETILNQYNNREMLFDNHKILPKFKSFVVIKAVQSLGEGDDRFNDWFTALEYMKSEIDKQDYDVCLIGCGAYGFHLAAHVKRNGKKSVHLGGALQLLFGIKGKRWENPNYGVKAWGIPVGAYSNMINEYWVRPGDQYKPKNSDKVEGACYW